jgi:hypothetical protein
MDREYRQMMFWVAVTLIGSILAAIVIVELTLRYVK